jgi:hypothetical protein
LKAETIKEVEFTLSQSLCFLNPWSSNFITILAPFAFIPPSSFVPTHARAEHIIYSPFDTLLCGSASHFQVLLEAVVRASLPFILVLVRGISGQPNTFLRKSLKHHVLQMAIFPPTSCNFDS